MSRPWLAIAAVLAVALVVAILTNRWWTVGSEPPRAGAGIPYERPPAAGPPSPGLPEADGKPK